MGSKELQKKAHEKLTGKTDERSPEHVELDRRLAEVVGAKPWEGKRTLDASPKLQRCKFTEEQLSERRVELLKMHARTPMLQDEEAAAKELASQKKDQLKGHLAAIGGHAATTVAGWESREVDTVEVEERRASLGVCAVRYRCDTGEEIGIRELRADELQSTIPGS